jgi:hypothetical protein
MLFFLFHAISLSQDKKEIPWWLGISPRGIAVYDKNDKTTPRKVGMSVVTVCRLMYKHLYRQNTCCVVDIALFLVPFFFQENTFITKNCQIFAITVKAVTLWTRNWWLYKTDGYLGQIVLKGTVLQWA